MAFYRRAAQLRLDAYQELCEIEGLGQIVIRARFEMHHLAVDFIPRREHQHGQRRVRAAHSLQEFGAAQLRQHQVEDQQIVFVGVDVVLAVPAIRGQIDRKALRAQSAGHEFRQLPIVFDEQYPHPRLLDFLLDLIKIRKCLETRNFPGIALRPRPRGRPSRGNWRIGGDLTSD